MLTENRTTFEATRHTRSQGSSEYTKMRLRPECFASCIAPDTTHSTTDRPYKNLWKRRWIGEDRSHALCSCICISHWKQFHMLRDENEAINYQLAHIISAAHHACLYSFTLPFHFSARHWTAILLKAILSVWPSVTLMMGSTPRWHKMCKRISIS